MNVDQLKISFTILIGKRGNSLSSQEENFRRKIIKKMVFKGQKFLKIHIDHHKGSQEEMAS